MTVLNRRALMIASIAVPVLTCPNAAPADTGADAELIAMGVHLNAVLPEMHRMMIRGNERTVAGQTAAKKEITRRGLTSEDYIGEVYLRHEHTAGA